MSKRPKSVYRIRDFKVGDGPNEWIYFDRLDYPVESITAYVARVTRGTLVILPHRVAMTKCIGSRLITVTFGSTQMHMGRILAILRLLWRGKTGMYLLSEWARI